MPVLKVYKDGIWEELGGTSPMDGGNADTLEGYHAYDFALADHEHAIDDTLSSTSTNPVQNKVINKALNEKAAITQLSSLQSNISSIQTSVSTLNRMVTSKADASHVHSEYAPMYSCGTDDLTAGTSELETGKLYFVYE